MTKNRDMIIKLRGPMYEDDSGPKFTTEYDSHWPRHDKSDSRPMITITQGFSEDNSIIVDLKDLDKLIEDLQHILSQSS